MFPVHVYEDKNLSKNFRASSPRNTICVSVMLTFRKWEQEVHWRPAWKAKNKVKQNKGKKEIVVCA